MKRVPARLAAVCGAVLLAHPAGTDAQSLPLPQAAATTACPTAREVTSLHLYGLWRAQFKGDGEGVSASAGVTLLLEKNPNHADGLSGSLHRDGVKTLVAGDVDHGDFTLEESGDGRTISATWTGQILNDSCGKEIHGTWTHDNHPPRPFVLRKQPGWR